ncbi:hypothetical protein K474DRAFT_1630985 [Panus rudis PR-1116 ss-1]|nr:hypothetical protein K474DRAFT_1630985 [Panus rudis PR-1116 ss-1]
MGATAWLAAPFKFAPIPVSIVTFVVYGLLFFFVLITDKTPDLTHNLRGLNLTQAYEDLHKITARPHPYNSHANDDVHQFLLSRVQAIAANSDFVHVSNDLVSNASHTASSIGYSAGTKGLYFEGANILVKIDGTESSPSSTDGVVFAAHYDSVSTGYGATDIGMGVVTLLQLAEYWSQPNRRPKRSAFFLINNGEEDGLHGSHMFFEHPWVNLTSTFINVEGAGAGGRPLLFRSTSLQPVRAYAAGSVAHPNGNTLSIDVFSRGLIRSATDFEVFQRGLKDEKKGLRGLDIAFYRNRAFYHSPQDSIPGMGRGEARRSLSALMDTIQGAGEALLNDNIPDDGGDAGVYFDLFGKAMWVFTRTSVFVTNVVLLILGPISVIVLLAWVFVLDKKHEGSSAPEEESPWTKVKKVLTKAIGWGRFWLAFVVCIAAHAGLVAGYVKLNAFVVYGHQWAVLLTSISLTYLGIVVPLTLFHIFFPSPPTSQKLAITLELFFLTWILLVLATVGLRQLNLGGFYWITAWYVCAWVSSLFGLAEAAERAKKGGEIGGKGELDLVGEHEDLHAEEDEAEGVRRVRGVIYEVPEGEAEGEQHDSEPHETEPTEITPLMQQHRLRNQNGREYVVGIDGEPLPVQNDGGKDDRHDETGWWILQFLSLVPFPAILLFQLQILLLHSLAQTLADGSSPIVVYAAVSILSTLLLLNIAPFAHKIHHGLTLFVFIVFIISLVYSWTIFPFSREAPLKLFFQQKLELDIPSLRQPQESLSQVVPEGSVVRAVTYLAGPKRYMESNLILPELPSSWGKNVTCEVDSSLRPGLWACGWNSDLLPSPGGEDTLPSSPHTKASDWLQANITRTGPASAFAVIKGTNTRSCRLKFDHFISSYNVLNGSPGGARFQPGYEISERGVNDLILWTRTWDNEFRVELDWSNGTSVVETLPLSGKVACEWQEFASASAGAPWAATSGQIPAYEEVLHFLPLWATVNKWTYGLVEAEAPFSI